MSPPIGEPSRPSLVSRVTALLPGTVQKKNKAVVLQMLDAFNKANTDIVPRLLSPNVRSDSKFPLRPELERAPVPQRVQEEIKHDHQAFPDTNFTVKEIVAEGDKVILIWQMTGTHQGELFGRPATGRKVSVEGYEVVQISNGRIIRHTDNHAKQTTLELLGQLGPDWISDPEFLGPMGIR
jgi:steroid delta-isomerase-like uncharacterized protein